jgi:hypothetical protein
VVQGAVQRSRSRRAGLITGALIHFVGSRHDGSHCQRATLT